MRRVLRVLLALLAMSLVVVALGQSAASAGNGKPRAHPPKKVVIIVVDALSREIVEKYKMRNVQALMRDGADSPNGYLGHLGSVTVVTHNVLTTGALPKNMGWTDEGYRDVDGLLTSQDPDPKVDGNDMWLTSNFGSAQMSALQNAAGYPKLADYLHAKRPGSTVVAISPKSYAGWGLAGGSTDRMITFGSKNADCDGGGLNWRGPGGLNVPTYLSQPAVRPLLRRLELGVEVRHRGLAGLALPARRQPLHGGPRPCPRGRRRLGGRRRDRHDEERAQVERRVRHAARCRQGRAHVGQHRRPRRARCR